MNFISNLRISNKLLLLTSIPTLALIIFAVIAVTEKMSISGKMEHVEVMSHIASKASDLVHELQKERGMTAGFLASGGKSFAGQIGGQRSTVDNKLADLQEYIKSADMDALDKGFVSDVDKGLSMISEIGDKRQRISALNIKVGEIGRAHV